MKGRGVIDFDYPLQIFTVPFVQMPNRGAFVSRMLEMLLKKLQASAILFDELAPRLNPDRDVVFAVDQSACWVRATRNVGLGKVVIAVGQDPEVPANAIDGVKAIIH